MGRVYRVAQWVLAIENGAGCESKMASDMAERHEERGISVVRVGHGI